MDYVKNGRAVRTVCYMNLAPSSFVPGRAMRAVIRVVQEGESFARAHKCCLDTGSDVNISIRHLLHDVRKIEKESVSTCGDETAFVEEGFYSCLCQGSFGRSLRSRLCLLKTSFPLVRCLARRPWSGRSRCPTGRPSRREAKATAVPRWRQNFAYVTRGQRGARGRQSVVQR
jgi:hypothetical protein